MVERPLQEVEVPSSNPAITRTFFEMKRVKAFKRKAHSGRADENEGMKWMEAAAYEHNIIKIII